MTSLRLLLISFFALALIACGDDGGGTDTGTDTGTGTDGATDTGTGTDGATDTGTGTDGATDGATDGGTDAGGGTECLNLNACGDTEWCDFPDNLCGTTAGVCRPRPSECDPSDQAPVCSCRGATFVFQSACAANMAGFDVNNAGGCDVPEGAFECGGRFCQNDMEFCTRSVSDIGGEADGYTCTALPAACMGSTDCGCFTDTACMDMCVNDGAGVFTLTCPGG